MTIFTMIALFCVQPAAINIAQLHLIDTIQKAPEGPPSGKKSSPNSTQMPEIEVAHFDGELLHSTSNPLPLPLVGKVHHFTPLIPHDARTFPLFRPPNA